MTDALLVLTTLPNPDAAAQVARTLVGEKLAACANILPAVRSIYRWQGQVQDEAETLVLIKTQRQHFQRRKNGVPERHPFEVPEVIALPLEAGRQPYLDWIARETGYPVLASAG